MTIPNKPFRASDGHTEFGTSGRISLAAASAGMATPFRIGDLAGKSAFIKPSTMIAYMANVGLDIGNEGLQTNGGTLNGQPAPAVIVSSKYSMDGRYTASTDLGLRGNAVPDSDIANFGLDPKQYIKIGGVYNGTPVIVIAGKFCHGVVTPIYGTGNSLQVAVGEWIGTPPMQGASRSHQAYVAYPALPANNQYMSIGFGFDRGAEETKIYMFFREWGVINVTPGDIIWQAGNQSGPTQSVGSLPVYALPVPITLNGHTITSIDVKSSQDNIYSAPRPMLIFKDSVGNEVNVGDSVTFYDLYLNVITFDRTQIGVSTKYAYMNDNPNFTIENHNVILLPESTVNKMKFPPERG